MNRITDAMFDRRQARVTLVPKGGLCNRLRAIEAAIEFARFIGSSLQVIWVTGGEMGAKYSDLFENSGAFSLIEISQRRGVSGARLASLGIRTNRQIYQWIRKFRYDTIFVDSGVRGAFIPADQAQKLRGKRILVETCECFYQCSHLGDLFAIPKIALQEDIDWYASRFPGKPIGLHIRRTDNAQSLLESPLEKFYEIIGKHLDAEPKTKFFLATDCHETESQLTARFPDKILTREKNYGRGCLPGMRDAVIDLFLLARCSQIYGSYWSSFSIMAARLGSDNLHIVRR